MPEVRLCEDFVEEVERRYEEMQGEIERELAERRALMEERQRLETRVAELEKRIEEAGAARGGGPRADPRSVARGSRRDLSVAMAETLLPQGQPVRRVCFITGCDKGGAHRYRCHHPAEQLALHGIAGAVLDYYHDDLSRPAVASADVLILHRVAWEERVERLVDKARASGRFVVFDTDDLVFEPGLTSWVRVLPTLPPGEVEAYHDGVRRYLRTLEAADCVMTSTPVLAEFAERRGKPAFVHRNALCAEQIVLSERCRQDRQRAGPPGRLTIGYFSGTNTHDRDFEEAAPAVARCLEEFPELILRIGGLLNLPPVLTPWQHRIDRVPLVDWRRLPEVIGSLDISLAPLEEGNPYCRAKSELKYFEAGILGVPTVASRIDPYQWAIQDARQRAPGERGRGMARGARSPGSGCRAKAAGRRAGPRRRLPPLHARSARSRARADVRGDARGAAERRRRSPPTPRGGGAGRRADAPAIPDPQLDRAGALRGVRRPREHLPDREAPARVRAPLSPVRGGERAARAGRRAPALPGSSRSTSASRARRSGAGASRWRRPMRSWPPTGAPPILPMRFRNTGGSSTSCRTSSPTSIPWGRTMSGRRTRIGCRCPASRSDGGWRAFWANGTGSRRTRSTSRWTPISTSPVADRAPGLRPCCSTRGARRHDGVSSWGERRSWPCIEGCPGRESSCSATRRLGRTRCPFPTRTLGSSRPATSLRSTTTPTWAWCCR